MQDTVRGIRILNIGEPLDARTGAGLVLFISTFNPGHATVLHAEAKQAAVGAISQAGVVDTFASAFVE